MSIFHKQIHEMRADKARAAGHQGLRKQLPFLHRLLYGKRQGYKYAGYPCSLLPYPALDCGPALGGFEDLVGNCSTSAALINAHEFCNQVAYAAYLYRIQIPK